MIEPSIFVVTTQLSFENALHHIFLNSAFSRLGYSIIDKQAVRFPLYNIPKSIEDAACQRRDAGRHLLCRASSRCAPFAFSVEPTRVSSRARDSQEVPRSSGSSRFTLQLGLHAFRMMMAFAMRGPCHRKCGPCSCELVLGDSRRSPTASPPARLSRAVGQESDGKGP
jgi:hypothetical protein